MNPFAKQYFEDADRNTAAELILAAVRARIVGAVIEANGGVQPTPAQAREHGHFHFGTDGIMSVTWRGKEVFTMNRRVSFATPRA